MPFWDDYIYGISVAKRRKTSEYRIEKCSEGYR